MKSAFVSTEQPNSEKWAEADRRVLDLMSNVTLFSLYGNRFGGDGIRTFAYPVIKDVTADALTFSYYICIKGIFPTTTGSSSPVSFIKQYPLNMRQELPSFRKLDDHTALAGNGPLKVLTVKRVKCCLVCGSIVLRLIPKSSFLRSRSQRPWLMVSSEPRRAYSSVSNIRAKKTGRPRSSRFYIF